MESFESLCMLYLCLSSVFKCCLSYFCLDDNLCVEWKQQRHFLHVGPPGFVLLSCQQWLASLGIYFVEVVVVIIIIIRANQLHQGVYVTTAW